MNRPNNFRYILFDAANTLMHKPAVWENMLSVLLKHGVRVPLEKLQYNHKFLSECTAFPDRTSKDFYANFNRELLLSLGVIPSDALVEEIYMACSNLPWEKFTDTEALRQIELPMGILSNFNNTLPGLVQRLFGDIFTDIIVSEQVQLRKPSVAFYERAIELTGVKKEEILYIGDSLKLDVIPAQQAGMEALLIDREGFFPENTPRITDLYELTRKYI